MEVRLVCRLQPKVHWVPEIYYKFGTLEEPCGFHGLVCQATGDSPEGIPVTMILSMWLPRSEVKTTAEAFWRRRRLAFLREEQWKCVVVLFFVFMFGGVFLGNIYELTNKIYYYICIYNCFFLNKMAI